MVDKDKRVTKAEQYSIKDKEIIFAVIRPENQIFHMKTGFTPMSTAVQPQ